MLTRHRNLKQLRFEQLENRTLMAGDVMAMMMNGILQISGDAADNAIQMSQSGKEWQVQGSGTTVNGLSTTQTFTGVLHLAINLGEGNDTLNVSQGKLRDGALRIRDEGGVNTVNLSKISAGLIDIIMHFDVDTITLDKCTAQEAGVITRPTSYESAADADVVTIRNSKFKDFLGVSAGGGDDIVTLQNVVSDGDCILLTRHFIESDDDQVTLTKFRAKDALSIATGNGSDTITLNDVHSKHDEILIVASNGDFGTEDGNDVVHVEKSSSKGPLTIDAGDGADEVSVVKYVSGDGLGVLSSTTEADGSDTVALINIKCRLTFVVKTGNGADHVTLTNLRTDDGFWIDLSLGDADELGVFGVRGLGAILLGGDGVGDKVVLRGNKWRGPVRDVYFDVQEGSMYY